MSASQIFKALLVSLILSCLVAAVFFVTGNNTVPGKANPPQVVSSLSSPTSTNRVTEPEPTATAVSTPVRNSNLLQAGVIKTGQQDERPAATATSSANPTEAIIAPHPTTPASPDLPELQHIWLNQLPLTLYVPEAVKAQTTTQVLIALHGIGGHGDKMAAGLMNFADQSKVVVVAPTFNYNSNWQDPEVVAAEDVALSNSISGMVDELGTVLHSRVKDRLLLYGFSRGAQLAHRFAMLYPERVLGVAVLSAGSYTLPYKAYSAKNPQPIPFPYGVGDLQKYTNHPFNAASFAKISFVVEVGALDNDPNQTPRAWDSYIGRSRLERAQNFYQALKQIGMNPQFGVFPNTGHQDSPPMRDAACSYLKKLLVTRVA